MANIERRIDSNGKERYRVKVRLKGHPQASGSFLRLTDAKRWAQVTEAAIRERRYFKTTESRRHTFAELADRYVSEVLQDKPKNAANSKQHMLWWKSKLGEYLLADITPAMVVEYRDALKSTVTRRKKPMSNATIVRYMATLSHACNIAVKDWQWLDDSPMRRVSKPKEPRGRERFLSVEEREALLTACKASTSEHLYAVVVLALSTGMRRGEIMGLSWNQVDFQRERIVLTETKNNTSRAVPLTGLAHTLLIGKARVRRIDTDIVFYSDISKRPVDLTKPWNTALQKANIRDFRFHDLRHSAASYLAMSGATTIEIAAVLGHKTLQMVKRYSHLTNSHTHSIVGAMNKNIFGTQL